MTEKVCEEPESAIELTKRLMKTEPIFRLRETERTLGFLIHILKERVQTAEDIMNLYGFSKNDPRYIEQKNIKLVAQDLIRRYSGILQGKKKHFGFKAWWRCGDLLRYWEKQEKKSVKGF